MSDVCRPDLSRPVTPVHGIGLAALRAPELLRLGREVVPAVTAGAYEVGAVRLVARVPVPLRFDRRPGGRQADDAPRPGLVATHLQVIPSDPDLDLVHIQPKPRCSVVFHYPVPFPATQSPLRSEVAGAAC